MGSARPLSSIPSGAAQISFVKEGKVLMVTEKATSKIIIYTINQSGEPSATYSVIFSTPTLFGFDAGEKNSPVPLNTNRSTSVTFCKPIAAYQV